MTTIRQSIINNIMTRLATITTANGYETNAGNGVYEWREYAIEQSEYPVIVLRDREASTPVPGYYVHDHALTLTFSIYAGGSSVSSTLRKVLGDVITCIAEDLTFGGYVYDVEPVGDETDQEHEETRIGSIDYGIIIKYRTEAFNPYNLEYV